jgi:acetolactate decarboxylase
MRNVMWKGELAGLIRLDTISPSDHLYGIGPMEGLRGEILVFDGIPYISRVVDGVRMKVDINSGISAPFFAHARIPGWQEVVLPDSIRDLSGLEKFLDKLRENDDRPTLFRLKGHFHTADIHVVDLPEGTIVRSPDDAHRGLRRYVSSGGLKADVLGFYSRRHKSIFTHHDTNIHLHLIDDSRQWMGHVDTLGFDAGQVTLMLPVMDTLK